MFTTRTLVASLGVLAATLLGSAAVVPAAHASADTDVTWSVTPADESGPDTRGVIQQELDPGASRDDFFAVTNLSSFEVTFALSAADGYYNENGRFNMLPSDRESVDAGQWIDLPETVTVAAGGTAVVPFTTTVPDDAVPGDHAAGIAASVRSAGTDDGGAAVGVESRVGFRVTTRVTGEIVPSYAISGVQSSYELSWNPFRPGAAETSFTVENTGNATLLFEGVVGAGTGSTTVPVEGEQRPTLLPGESRRITVPIADVWPTVFVPGSIDLAPTASDLGGEPVDVAPQSADAGFWAVPVSQLLVLLGLVLIVLALFWRRRRFAAALDRAREEGRASAAGPSAATAVGAPVAPSSGSPTSTGAETRRFRRTRSTAPTTERS
ncbi:WxL protein peptidoglycan domain-containing protein [Microbacterium sp. LMI1-1-1.1]|uniref:WxL protein peptidoglycan domain-containing protein n=1 Tax=unclassified Microbacterium TaxID=2609290 RepID=UPI00346702A7